MSIKQAGCEHMDRMKLAQNLVVAGSCEHGTELSGSMKDEKFLE
jgi:hypothetical protein